MGDTYGSSGGYNGNTRFSKTGDNQKTGRSKRQKSRNIAPKCLLQIPARFGIAMCTQGWILRNEIIWQKPNCMPTSVKDRFTVDFEKLFFFVKSKRYYFKQQLEPYKRPVNRWGGNQVKPYHGKFHTYDTPAERYSSPRARIQRPQGASLERARQVRPNPRGRNKRCVWNIPTQPYMGAHFSVFPEKLIETPIKAGCPKAGIVLDPFLGSGTTAVVARKLGRRYLGIELNPDYIQMAHTRLQQDVLL
jgi:site-specific DNA-methyltransferase (adenine-specific)